MKSVSSLADTTGAPGPRAAPPMTAAPRPSRIAKYISNMARAPRAQGNLSLGRRWGPGPGPLRRPPACSARTGSGERGWARPPARADPVEPGTEGGRARHPIGRRPTRRGGGPCSSTPTYSSAWPGPGPPPGPGDPVAGPTTGGTRAGPLSRAGVHLASWQQDNNSFTSTLSSNLNPTMRLTWTLRLTMN